MSWQILLAISLIAAAIQTLLQRVLLKNTPDRNPVIFLIITQYLAAVFLIVFALIRGVSFPNLSPFLPNIILMLALYSLGPLFWFKSLQLIEASTFTVLFATRAFWSIIAAVIFLGESFSVKQSFGVFLIFLSVVLVSFNLNSTKVNLKKLRLSTGQLYALLAALLIGGGFVNDGIMLRQIDAFFYVPMAFLLPTTVVYLVNFNKTKEVISQLKGKQLFSMILLGFIFATTAICYLLAYQVGRNAAQIASINQIQIIITVILAIIFLKERSDMSKKILAAIISFVGVLLIT